MTNRAAPLICSVTRFKTHVSLALSSCAPPIHSLPTPSSHTHTCITSSCIMVKPQRCGTGSKAAGRWLSAAVGTAVTLVACFVSSANSADEQGFQLVVPSTTALPSIEPPSSLNRSANNILPVGTSEELSEALPNRLHTNKFYSNFLVRCIYLD